MVLAFCGHLGLGIFFLFFFFFGGGGVRVLGRLGLGFRGHLGVRIDQRIEFLIFGFLVYSLRLILERPQNDSSLPTASDGTFRAELLPMTGSHSFLKRTQRKTVHYSTPD